MPPPRAGQNCQFVTVQHHTVSGSQQPSPLQPSTRPAPLPHAGPDNRPLTTKHSAKCNSPHTTHRSREASASSTCCPCRSRVKVFCTVTFVDLQQTQRKLSKFASRSWTCSNKPAACSNSSKPGKFASCRCVFSLHWAKGPRCCKHDFAPPESRGVGTAPRLAGRIPMHPCRSLAGQTIAEWWGGQVGSCSWCTAVCCAAHAGQAADQQSAHRQAGRNKDQAHLQLLAESHLPSVVCLLRSLQIERGRLMRRCPQQPPEIKLHVGTAARDPAHSGKTLADHPPYLRLPQGVCPLRRFQVLISKA